MCVKVGHGHLVLLTCLHCKHVLFHERMRAVVVNFAGLPESQLLRVAKASVTVPASTKVHPRLERAHIADRLAQIESECE